MMKNLQKPNQGSVLVAAVLMIAVLSAAVAISVNRNATSQLSTSLQSQFSEMDIVKDTLIQDVLLRAKEHVWVDGDNVGSLLPTGVNRFEEWYTATHNVMKYESGGAGATAVVDKAVDYIVEVADNSDGDGDFTLDADNKVYVRLSYSFEGQQQVYLMLISPGSPAVVTSVPADIVAGTGACVEDVSLGKDFIYDLKKDSFVSGLDTTRAGHDDTGGFCTPRVDPFGAALPDYCGCGASGVDCPGPLRDIEDTYVASSNIFADIEICKNAQCEPVENFEGKEPDTHPVTDPVMPPGEFFSFYEADADDPSEEYTEYCNSVSRVLDVSDALLAADDPRVTYYEKSDGGKLNVNGDIVFGTEAAPEIVYIKTPNQANKVKFNGNISGYGILIVLGNATFTQDLDWNGLIYNDDIVKGTTMQVNGNITNYGSVMMQNMRVNTRFDHNGGKDFLFKGNSDLYYSSYAIDNVMQELDDNYTSVSVSQPVLVEYIQRMN